jgi:hypothetical protein
MHSFRLSKESTPVSRTITGNPAAPQPSAREELYKQHFAAQAQQAQRPAGFIEQVNGFGVQLFSQASLFGKR